MFFSPSALRSFSLPLYNSFFSLSLSPFLYRVALSKSLTATALREIQQRTTTTHFTVGLAARNGRRRRSAPSTSHTVEATIKRRAHSSLCGGVGFLRGGSQRTAGRRAIARGRTPAPHWARPPRGNVGSARATRHLAAPSRTSSRGACAIFRVPSPGALRRLNPRDVLIRVMDTNGRQLRRETGNVARGANGTTLTGKRCALFDSYGLYLFNVGESVFFSRRGNSKTARPPGAGRVNWGHIFRVG